MTVETSNITSGPYTGNGLLDEYDYDFRITNKSQLIVYETDDDGVQTILTVDTDYTVAGVGVDEGGTVTRVAGNLPTGYTWYIRSNYLAQQETAFASQGGFFPRTHEAAFDKLTMLMQQVEDQIQRSLRLASGYSGSASPVLSAPVAGAYLRWSNDGLSLINDDAISVVATITGAISTVAGIADEVEDVAAIAADVTEVADNMAAVVAAPAAAALAMQWAIKTDGPVADGEYSAKYWAQQAEAIVQNTYLPLAGGTMTGVIVFDESQTFPVEGVPGFLLMAQGVI